MSTLTINAINYNSWETAFAANAIAPTAGSYYCCGDIGSPPTESMPAYDDKQIKFPGVYAIGTKRLTYSGRQIHCELVCVGASKAAAANAAASAMNSFTSLTRFTISLPDGVSRPGCKGQSANITKWEQFKGMYGCIVQAEFIQLLDPNHTESY